MHKSANVLGIPFRGVTARWKRYRRTLATPSKSSSATLTKMRGCGRSSKNTSAHCGEKMSLLSGMIAKLCRVLNGKVKLMDI